VLIEAFQKEFLLEFPGALVPGAGWFHGLLELWKVRGKQGASARSQQPSLDGVPQLPEVPRPGQTRKCLGQSRSDIGIGTAGFRRHLGDQAGKEIGEFMTPRLQGRQLQHDSLEAK